MLLFLGNEVDIDHLRQRLLQFRSRLLIRVRISEIIDDGRWIFSQDAGE